MKKMIAILLCAVCLLGLAACDGNKRPLPTGSEETAGSMEALQMANPFVSYDTMEEAGTAVGFDFLVPDMVNDYAERNIQVMNGEMLQVTYLTEAGEMLILRKAKGSDDISGDYTVYADTKTVTLPNGAEAELRGGDGSFQSAVWTLDDYTYAVSSDLPMDENAMVELISTLDLAD